MFEKSIEDRISAWAEHRSNLNISSDPFTETWEFWQKAPYIPYNKDIDPFNPKLWPTPWEIIVENKYDDFTKALMIARSLKFTDRFKNSKIEIKTLVNNQNKCYYNVVCVDDLWAINYNDNGPVKVKEIPEAFYLENLIEVEMPR
jgi:hypothetical protein